MNEHSKIIHTHRLHHSYEVYQGLATSCGKGNVRKLARQAMERSELMAAAVAGFLSM